MDLVDDDDTVADAAELVLGVHQNDTRLPADLLPTGEKPDGRLRDSVPVCLRHQAALHNLGRGDALVVPTGIGALGGGGDDGRRQGVALPHSVRQHQAVHLAFAALVGVPERGGGDAGNVASNDYLDGECHAFVRQHDVRVGRADHVAGHDIGQRLEPETAQLVENLPLVGHHTQYAIKGRQAIGGDEQAPIAQHVAVAYFAAVYLAQFWQVDGAESMSAGTKQIVAGRYHSARPLWVR